MNIMTSLDHNGHCLFVTGDLVVVVKILSIGIVTVMETLSIVMETPLHFMQQAGQKELLMHGVEPTYSILKYYPLHDINYIMTRYLFQVDNCTFV